MTNDDYQCHACELKEFEDVSRNPSETERIMDGFPDKCSGFTLFWEFGLLVGPPLNGLIDVHGCGRHLNDPFFNTCRAIHGNTSHSLGVKMKWNDARLHGSLAHAVQIKFHLNAQLPDLHPRTRNHTFWKMCWIELLQVQIFYDKNLHEAIEEDDCIGALVKEGMHADKELLTMTGTHTLRSLLDRPKETILLI